MAVTKETHQRSIVKTVSWRVCATLTTMLIVFLFTKKLTLALGVGVVEIIAKALLYYLHERFWSKISWGCAKHPLSQLPVNKELSPKDASIIRNKLKDLGYID